MAILPNILLIYTDQQRFDTIGALGNPLIDTPHLDRLVREGWSFTHATTPSPVCMAARWSLHTGQWTTTHGCFSNHHPGPRPSFDLPTLLRRAGYRTGHVGKNHTFLGAQDWDFWREDPMPPARPEALQARRKWCEEVGKVRYPRLSESAVPGGAEADPERGKTAAALEFLASGDERPFFLWLSYHHPHTPYWAPEPFFSQYQNAPLPPPVREPEGLQAAGKPFRQWFYQENNDAILPFTPQQVETMRRVYYAMISQVDAEIGRVLDELDRRQLTENTLVVFTSDHGDYLGNHGLVTKSPALYDDLVRVPLIFRWTGTIKANRRDNRFASHVDLLPTFLALAESACPPQVDGTDLGPFLLDGRTEPIRAATFSEYGVPGELYTSQRVAEAGWKAGMFPNPGNPHLPWEGNPVSLAGRIRMIRTHRWKFVKDGQNCELYDLAGDPDELINLWKHPDYGDVEARLQTDLESWKQTLRPNQESA